MPYEHCCFWWRVPGPYLNSCSIQEEETEIKLDGGSSVAAATVRYSVTNDELLITVASDDGVGVAHIGLMCAHIFRNATECCTSTNWLGCA